MRLIPASRRVSEHITIAGSRNYSLNHTGAIHMANAHKIKVPVTNTGLWKFKQQDSSADKVSELLQKDLEKHHVFFNNDGFHNHIPHHLLALYGTGAGPEAIQMGYKENENYQRPAKNSHDGVADELHDWEKAKKYLGRERHYPDFLLFYQREIERLGGWQEALNEHLFKGDERADDLFQRMFAGFLHPIIQLMYGVEWEQPAIVAEGLAQAAVHKNELKPFFEETERRAREAGAPMPKMAELVEEVRGNEKLVGAVRMGDRNKVFDGVLVRAPEEMKYVASKVRVSAEELDERTAEMFHACAWIAGCAAQKPGKEARWDFFLIHHLNSSPIFLSFNAAPWISTENKIRMLEHKIRLDLVQYAARGSPELRIDAVRSYRPKDQDQKKPLVSKPTDLLSRFHNIPDDGHTIKVVRALGICQELSDKYAGRPWVKIKDEDWLKLHYSVLDGTEHVEEKWVRTTGLDEAWKTIPARD
ncbi:HypA protein [Colletotrichum sojae]|uniref:HypA protein n=1 Tax=Colletotrichum sojae TaxID=2175907 RepID=A0A8H6J8C4_9PEZI|nr:HypA protein [Colletotrichum sojae]